MVSTKGIVLSVKGSFFLSIKGARKIEQYSLRLTFFVALLCSINSFVFADVLAVVKSASEDNYPPFCIVSADGKADGFSVELLSAALSEVHRDVVFKTGPWEQLKKDLADGALQVLPLVGRTPEREALYDFTFPYLTLHGAVFVRKGDARIKDVGDLLDKSIMVMRGDNAEEFSRRTKISSRIIPIDTYEEAMRLLAAGKADAVIAQRLMGIQLLTHMNLKTVVPLDFPLQDFRQDFCFAVRDGDRELLSYLNEGLSLVIANGTFDRLHKKWFGPILKQRVTFKDVSKYVVIILIPIIIAFSVVLIVFLRREVKRKTKKLVREIEERKRTEEALKKAQLLLNETGKTARVGGWEIDLESQKLTWTEEIYHIHEVDEGFQPTVEGAINYYEASSRPVIERAVKRAIEQGESFDLELEIVTAKGNRLWVHALGRAQRDGGRVKKVFGIFQDITERKRAEEKLREVTGQMRLILESAGEGICGIDCEGKTTFVNAAALRMTGYEAAEMIGKSHHALIHHTKVDRTPYICEECPIYAAFSDAKTHYKDEEVFWRKDGTSFEVEYTSTPMHNDQGELVGAVVVFNDISERKKAEEKDQRRARELKVFYDASIGREERILGLKREVESLKRELGRPSL
ncbi:MAG: transporter substrate-binding domain-containing protein [Candidatus Omnitrophica bacterium]|nr:transporter substrate-binding domain-containing protein [Candidatus Omnitrophota bacterium]